MNIKSKYKSALTKRFVYKVSEDGIVYPQFETFPSELGRLLDYYIGIYETPKRIEAVLDKINEHRTRENNMEHLGGNDTTFIVKGELTTFDNQYVSEIPPITIETNEAIEFFERYKVWITRFEKGEIPGLTQPNPNKFRILYDKHDHSIYNRTIKLKGSFFILAEQSIEETVQIINTATNLELKKNETGFYEELPAFTNYISGVEYTILGIPVKEYQMKEYKYDNFHFRIHDYSKVESNEWINEGNRVKEFLKQKTNLKFKE
jgi:hypothetical protein